MWQSLRFTSQIALDAKIARDAGTHEGAVKAAATRKSHGGGHSETAPYATPPSTYSKSHHDEAADYHEKAARAYAYAKGKEHPGYKAHTDAEIAHRTASTTHERAIKAGYKGEHAERAKSFSERATGLSQSAQKYGYKLSPSAPKSSGREAAELKSQSRLMHENNQIESNQKKSDKKYHETEARKLQESGKYGEARKHWRAARNT